MIYITVFYIKKEFTEKIAFIVIFWYNKYGDRMKINEVIFPDQLPKIDLHGYDRQTARVAIEDFIRDNVHLKNENFIIIHGIGSGILSKTTKEVLSRNKNVLEFATFYNNRGSTIVRIKIDKLWKK